MRFAKGERKETSFRMKFGPSISSGMMKKLEPVLQMKKRPMNCHTTLATVLPLNTRIKDRECIKNQEDVYCFPSSPGESTAEKTTKEENKKEKQVSKTKAKKILKKYAKKEVLESIKNTRESIQLLRSQLHESKDHRELHKIRGY